MSSICTLRAYLIYLKNTHKMQVGTTEELPSQHVIDFLVRHPIKYTKKLGPLPSPVWIAV